jgi:Icc-related predicted phosphoesterase
MIYRLLILLIITSCGKLQFSPYSAEVENYDVNTKNLARILSKADRFGKSVSFKIAVISDTHDYYDGLDKQISYINKNKSRYDFVIVTGDLSNVGLVSELMESKSRLDDLAIPYLTTSGNHDLLINGEKIFYKIFGNDTYAFEYQNTKLILFNNNNWESSKHVPDMNFLEHELVTNAQNHVILFSHVAPDDPDRFTHSQISTLRELVNRYGVSYYVNGHNHNYGDSKFGNARQVTAGSSSKKVLLELEINSIGVSHAFIKL